MAGTRTTTTSSSARRRSSTRRASPARCRPTASRTPPSQATREPCSEEGGRALLHPGVLVPIELDFECTRSSMVDAMDEPERQARTLSIADAAESSGLSAHTLRYYERAGLLEPVSRNGSGHRRYRDTDLELIAFLAKLRATGMPIRKVRRYAELMTAGEA